MPRVAPVAQLDKLAHTVAWSKYAHADFEFVNKRAYFDYQRRHVFARTKPARGRRSRKSPRRNWQNRCVYRKPYPGSLSEESAKLAR